MREADGIWPSLTPASVHVGPDGLAIIDDGSSPRQVRFNPLATEVEGAGSARFNAMDDTGLWSALGTIRLGDAGAADPGQFWGVRDARSDTALTWTDMAGAYGNGVFITEAGEIRGSLGGCAIHGAASDRAGQPVPVTLSGCDISGRYTGVLDLPANDTDTPALLVAGQNRGWRLER